MSMKGYVPIAAMVGLTLVNVVVHAPSRTKRFEPLTVGSAFRGSLRPLETTEPMLPDTSHCRLALVVSPTCPACSALAHRYVEEGAAEVPMWISLGDSAATATFVADHDLPRWRTYLVGSGARWADPLGLGIAVVPTELRIDAAGTVRYLSSGFNASGPLSVAGDCRG